MADVSSVILPDAHVIARNVLDSKAQKPGIREIDLARAIKSITLTGTIKDITNLQVVVEDPEWLILDSGLWDTDENGLLDPIDLNYPAGSPYWWRLTVISPSDSARELTLTFLDRMVIPLMQLKGPVKANRAKMTRAEFLKMLADRVKEYGGIRFFSKELRVRQPVAASTGTVPGIQRPPQTAPQAPASGSQNAAGPADSLISGALNEGVPAAQGGGRRASTPGGLGMPDSGQPAGAMSYPFSPGGGSSPAKGSGSSSAKPGQSASSYTPGYKAGGIAANASQLKVKGQRINPTQVHWANLILSVGFGLNAGTLPLQAAIFAAIMESGLGSGDMGWDASNPTYGGVLGGNVAYFGRYGSAGSDAVALAEAQQFFKGGEGYNYGGAIAASKTYSDPAELAARVEAPYDSSDPPPFGQYIREGGLQGIDQVRQEAIAIVNAAGGGQLPNQSGSTSVAQPYYFEVNPGETLWHAMTRLAQEVNWELFWDASGLYYDEEQSLITAPPAHTIRRGDPWVVDWNYDWDVRQVVTQMTLVVICDMFDFKQGQVVKLEGFGPASSGSTALPKKRPGCWLIQDVTRSASDFASTLTLVQPDLPKLEPAPQIKSSTTGTPASGGTPSSMRQGIVSAARGALSFKSGYSQARPMPSSLAACRTTPTDCSGFATLCYKQAGAQDPNGLGYDGQGYTGTMEQHGRKTSTPQPGDLAFWSSPDHVAVYIGGGQIIEWGAAPGPIQASVSSENGYHASFLGYRSYLP